MSFQDLISSSRRRVRYAIAGGLDCDAVVGVIDLRKRSARANAGTSHCPALAPPDVYAIAPADMTRLMDPIIVEASLTADVPSCHQGGDGALIPKYRLGNGLAMDNHMQVIMANQEPKLAGG